MAKVTSREEVIHIVQHEVAEYAPDNGFNADFYYLENVQQHVYSVIALPHKPYTQGIVSLVVRIDGDKIIIERDNNADPLFEVLLQKGIPREQIVLAHQDVSPKNG
jgi:hypothetical protein